LIIFQKKIVCFVSRKNPKFCQKSKLVLNGQARNFGQSSKFLPKLEFVVKFRNVVHTLAFWLKLVFLGQSWKFWAKLEVLDITRNVDQNSKFCLEHDILMRTETFGRKSKIWSKTEIFVKTRIFCQKIEIETRWINTIAIKHSRVSRRKKCVKFMDEKTHVFIK